MVPPSIRRAWWKGGAWAAVFFGLGMAQMGTALAGWTPRWLGASAAAVPFIGMVGVYWAMWSTSRAGRRYKASACGLCARCEYPLPERTEGEAAVRCPECGIVRTRAEHRRDWARWFSDLK